MNGKELDEMGPIDYLIVEWPDRQPTGEAAPHLIDLVDRGLIRILDLAFIAKAEDGSVAAIEIADLGDRAEAFAAFEGASSGLLSEEDVANRVSRRQGERWAQQEAQQPPPAPAAAAPEAGSQSTIDQLKELGELKAQGILTEEEFAAQKAKLLGS